MTDIYNLYIPATEVGVCEDFIMMEETETDKILINSKKYGFKDSDVLFIFIMILSDVFDPLSVHRTIE
ncbi:hypothetical protein [Paenibacillus polymyxa]|uniref:hypothetical protein n=1 Tax=Paenibacillus polymyxa TaxID=1406 RepID=UPI0039BF99E0